MKTFVFVFISRSSGSCFDPHVCLQWQSGGTKVFTKIFRFKKNVNFWCKIFRESDFQCLKKILSNGRLWCMILLIFHKVRKTSIFLSKKPEKPKGLFWSQALTDLKTSKDLKKDWGCALKCSLWGQNGGQIWSQLEILHEIWFRRSSPLLGDTP